MANDYIEMLKERDKAKPLYKRYFAPGRPPIAACPTCKEVIFSKVHGTFCEWCGQRLDKNNWEL